METPRLTGRPLTEGDIPFALQVWNDERVSALVGETMSEQQVRERIERWNRQRATHGCATELFYEHSTAQPIGWGGLQHSTIGIGERLTIGYAIAPDNWGRGYATEIALASVAYAFADLGADDVRASILSTNTRSRRVAENAGMSLECEITHGRHVEVIYVIDRAAWSRSRASGRSTESQVLRMTTRSAFSHGAASSSHDHRSTDAPRSSSAVRKSGQSASG